MGAIEFRDFDGDLEALSSMARDSWFEEYGRNTWPDLHQPDLARHYFSEVDDPRYLIGAYDGAKLVAFVANLPRTYRFNGQRYQGVVSCMLIGHKDYRRRGIAMNLIRECLRRNQEIGRDLALLTLEKKHRSSLLFKKYLEPRHRIEKLKRMYPIVRPIDFTKMALSENLKGYVAGAIKLLGAHRPLRAPACPGTVRPYRGEDLPAILQLTERYSDRNQLVRVFDERSLSGQLARDGITATVVYQRDGVVAGFMNFTCLGLVGPRGRHRWAWLDYLYWEGLSGGEKKALLAGLWEAARERGCIGIMEWNKNYYGKGVLFRSRFITYPRFLELCAWVFNPELSLRGIDKVFEQQI